NCPGFPDGISGPDLLARMRAHAARCGVAIDAGTVVGLAPTGVDGGFAADWRPAAAPGRTLTCEARAVLLATGVVDVEPRLARIERAIRDGYVRHCPICDGFEVVGERIGVIGFGAGALAEALFLRTYSSDVTLLTLGEPME